MSVFGSYANFYDLLYKDKDYPAEVVFIETLLKKYVNGTVKTILDMGCGTGGHALLLAERGYNVTGVDRSDTMLSIAEEKARKINGYAEFSQADIRDFDLDKKFDAVISMFAVMGYQTTNEDFDKALLSASKHLRPGGLFIFDVWFGPAVISQKPGDRVKIIDNNDERIIRMTRSKLDIMKHVVDVNFNVMKIRDNRIYEPVEETHRVRFFFPMELELFMSGRYFQILSMFPFLGIDEVLSEKNWDMTVVARKK